MSDNCTPVAWPAKVFVRVAALLREYPSVFTLATLLDVTCIWAGQATILIEAGSGNVLLGQVSLTLGDDPEQRSTVLDDYILELVKLEPYPVSTEQISQGKYVAHLTVTSQMPSL